MNIMQWFKSNGDHFLNSLALLLFGGTGTGILPPSWKYTPLVSAALAMLHTLFVPDQPAPPPTTGTKT